MNIVEALGDPDLFGPWFAGPSWGAWRAILKAAYALPMDDADLATFRTLAERDPPEKPVRELWVIAGRRSGKDSIASSIAAYTAAFTDYSKLLRPGENALVMCLACDRDQAKIVNRYTRAYFDEIPSLRGMIVEDTAESFRLSNRAEVAIHTNSFRAVRGRTIAACIMDECAFWRTDDAANPDVETYNAVAPGLAAPLKDTLLIGISSPYRRGGLMFAKWREHYGRPGDVLVIKAPSIALNPTLDQSIIDRALAADPEAAAAEWLGEWRSDLADFVDRRIVEAAVRPGVHELPRVPGTVYAAFVDPSGGSSDSMTMAVAHSDKDGRGILDCIREIRPPFSPEAVVQEFAQTIKNYGLRQVTGDRYAGEWPRERFREHGIDYITSEKSKSDLYRELLPPLNSGKLELLDNQRLVTQLCSLERRVGRGTGKDSIDHPPGSHDDVANSAAGALVAVVGEGSVAGMLQMWRILGDAPEQREIAGIELRAVQSPPPRPAAPQGSLPGVGVVKIGQKVSDD